MKRNIYTEFVNGTQTVQFERTLVEVPTADGMNLIVTHKRPVDRDVIGTIVFVHGLGQNRYSWTLTRRSLENFFVSQGLETFNAELRGHGLSRAAGSDYPTGFETYLQFDIPAILEAVYDISGGRKVFLIGHSLGGTIAYCLEADLQRYLAGIISIGGPFRMGQGNFLLRLGATVGSKAGNLLRLYRFHPRAFYIDVIGLLVKYGLFFFDNRFNRFPIQVWFPKSIERDILIERIEKGFDRTSFAVFWLMIEWA
ncbi:MAG: alpha/beta fold hydrolase, partial [Chloroflexi bacterium]